MPDGTPLLSMHPPLSISPSSSLIARSNLQRLAELRTELDLDKGVDTSALGWAGLSFGQFSDKTRPEAAEKIANPKDTTSTSSCNLGIIMYPFCYRENENIAFSSTVEMAANYCSNDDHVFSLIRPTLVQVEFGARVPCPHLQSPNENSLLSSINFVPQRFYYPRNSPENASMEMLRPLSPLVTDSREAARIEQTWLLTSPIGLPYRPGDEVQRHVISQNFPVDASLVILARRQSLESKPHVMQTTSNPRLTPQVAANTLCTTSKNVGLETNRTLIQDSSHLDPPIITRHLYHTSGFPQSFSSLPLPHLLFLERTLPPRQAKSRMTTPSGFPSLLNLPPLSSSRSSVASGDLLSVCSSILGPTEEKLELFAK